MLSDRAPAGRLSMEQLRRVWFAAANWGLALTGLVLYNALNALALILVARRVLPDVYGQYVAVSALAGFLVILPGFGMDAWILTQPQNSPAATSALWWSAVRARLPLLALWLVGMALLGVWLPTDTYPPAILWLTVLALALESLSLLSFASLRTQQRHGQVAALQAVSSGALLASVFLLPAGRLYIVYFAAGRALIAGVVAALSAVLLAREYGRAAVTLTPAREILNASRTFMAAEVASAVYVRADVTIVALARGSAGSGIYGPAVNMLQLAFLPLRALFFFIVPVLSSAHRQQEQQSFWRQGAVQSVAQLLLGGVLTLVLAVFAPYLIVMIFGETYAPAGDVLRLLSPIPLLRGLNFALGAILTSSEQQGPRTRVQILAALVSVVGNLLVVGPWGLAGVAFIYVLSELTLCLGYGVLVWRGRSRQSIS